MGALVIVAGVVVLGLFVYLVRRVGAGDGGYSGDHTTAYSDPFHHATTSHDSTSSSDCSSGSDSSSSDCGSSSSSSD
jgi:hypothetical protein